VARQLALEQKMRGTQELVTVEDLSSDRLKYFKGGMEIMAAEFYAIALPFHSCNLYLETVSPGSVPFSSRRKTLVH
jgi:hypothetical protein